MANPLKSILTQRMGGNNPLMQAMSSGNPQQMLMNMLQQKNPQGFQQLQQMMKSGQDPTATAQQMMSSLSPQQKQTVQQMMNQFNNNNG